MIFKIRNFCRNIRGNIATTSAIIIPMLLSSVAFVSDYTIMFHQRSALQEAADSAALASVKELGLVGADEKLINEVADAYVNAIFDEGSAISGDKTALEIVAIPSKEKSEVKIELSYTWTPFLAHVFDYRVTPIKVTATGALAGQSLTLYCRPYATATPCQIKHPSG